MHTNEMSIPTLLSTDEVENTSPWKHDGEKLPKNECDKNVERQTASSFWAAG